MAKAAEMDTQLLAGLKAAKSKRAYFALVLKGSNDGALIVSKTKVPPADIADAKKQSGGSAVLKGFCSYEEGTYVFETAKPAAATAAQAVKTIAKRDAGLALKAEFRVSAVPELLADEGDSPAPSTAAAQPDGAAVTKRFHAMTADITAAMGGPNDAQVKALFAAIRQQLQSKDFAKATQMLDQLAPLVKQPAKAAAQPDGAAIIKRFHALTPQITDAMGGPNDAQVKSLFATIRQQLKSNDFAKASELLDQLTPLVKKPDAAASPKSAASAPPAAAALAQPTADAVTKRLNGMTAEIKAALAGPNKDRVRTLFVAVGNQLKTKDFAAATKLLDELTPLVKNAETGAASQKDGASVQKDGAASKPDSPEMTAALAAWTAARSDAVGQLTKLVAAFKTSGHPQAGAGVALLEAVIKKNLTPRPATARQVDELVRYVQTDDIFTDAETPNPFGFTVKIREPLLAVLAELKKHAT